MFDTNSREKSQLEAQMKDKNIFFKTILIGVVLSLALMGCSPQNTKLHNIGLQFSSYNAARNNFLRLFLPEANAAVSNLKFCFKRLRFKTLNEPTNIDPAADSDNIDFNLGEVDIAAGATTLGTITLPEGDYVRVEFDLENSCASGKSIQLTNTHGSFTSTERITIKFEGNFTANIDGTLTLGVQQILDQLNNYNGTGTLKVSAEAASGVLAN